MSRHHISKPEVEALILGGLAGATMGWAAAGQRAQASIAQQKQQYQPPQKIPLSGSRNDHVANVIALLKQHNERLLSQREEANSKTIPHRNSEIEEFNKPRGFFSQRPKELIPLVPLVPIWKQVSFPSAEQILEGLNANSVWTKEELIGYANSLINNIFAEALECFHLLPIATPDYFAKQMRPVLERQKVEIVNRVKRINDWKRRLNSETKFLFFAKNPRQRIIPNYPVSIPSLVQLANRFASEKLKTWSDYYASQNKIEREIFYAIENDHDYIKYKSLFFSGISP